MEFGFSVIIIAIILIIAALVFLSLLSMSGGQAGKLFTGILGLG